MNLVKETLRFEKKRDPKTALGINPHFIENIEKTDEDEYSYKTNMDFLSKFLKKVMPSITDNELQRFYAFTWQDEILKDIPFSYFIRNDLDAIQDYCESAIRKIGKYWLQLHSDDAMRRGMA